MRELYRVKCRDAIGQLHIVIVRRKLPLLARIFKRDTAERGLILYSLADGRDVRFLDDHTFEIIEDGTTLTREP